MHGPFMASEVPFAHVRHVVRACNAARTTPVDSWCHGPLVSGRFPGGVRLSQDVNTAVVTAPERGVNTSVVTAPERGVNTSVVTAPERGVKTF
jgi:hypothetical protein